MRETRLSLSAALLVGGRSTRMGQDKALLLWQGQPLWRHQLDKLQALEPERVFVVGRPGRLALPPAIEALEDPLPDAGPLAGVVAALREVQSSHLLLLGVDLPHMTSGWLRQLWQACRPGTGVIPRTDRFEPLAAIYPKQLATLAEALFAQGERRLQRLASEAVRCGLLREIQVPADQRKLFCNVNTPEEWAKTQAAGPLMASDPNA